METIIKHTNSETLELILSQVKEIEGLNLKVKSISLEDIEDPKLELKGYRWTWEIKSSKGISDKEAEMIMEILDPDYDGDFSFDHGEKTYKFILELY